MEQDYVLGSDIAGIREGVFLISIRWNEYHDIQCVYIMCKKASFKKKHSYSKTLQILNIEGWPRIFHPSANGHWAVSRRIQAP